MEFKKKKKRVEVNKKQQKSIESKATDYILKFEYIARDNIIYPNS